jgi:hypothetical protein
VNDDRILPSDAFRIAHLEERVARLQVMVTELQEANLELIQTLTEGFDRVGELGAGMGEVVAQLLRRITNLENVHGK